MSEVFSSAVMIGGELKAQRTVRSFIETLERFMLEEAEKNGRLMGTFWLFAEERASKEEEELTNKGYEDT